MKKKDKKLPEFHIPPTSITEAGLTVFSERFVRMSGRDYYLRVYSDGRGEFTRYDTDSGKWVFLIVNAA